MSDHQSLHILVVEDEFLIATEIATILEDAGHQVLGPAGSVEAAETILAARRPDLAVIDANLSGETSVSLANRLHELGVPFCVCTGYSATDLFSSFGDVAMLQKPVTPRNLLAVVDSCFCP
jgi:DNA-binding response OmpR family regulator